MKKIYLESKYNLMDYDGKKYETAYNACKRLHSVHHSICTEYLCITDQEKDAVTLQKGETVNYSGWIKRVFSK